jgi:dihydroxy-acid dehydratase
MSENKMRPALRSRAWFDNPSNPDMTALYVERYLNFGLSLEEPVAIWSPAIATT